MKYNYGEMLKYHRLNKEKTLLEVEKETGINNANLSRWECNKVLPNIDFCAQLADYFEISLDELIGRNYNNEESIIPLKTQSPKPGEKYTYIYTAARTPGNKPSVRKIRVTQKEADEIEQKLKNSPAVNPEDIDY